MQLKNLIHGRCTDKEKVSRIRESERTRERELKKKRERAKTREIERKNRWCFEFQPACVPALADFDVVYGSDQSVVL